MTDAAPSTASPLAYAAPLSGLAVGYVAALLQGWYAPVGMFPLLVGVVVGAATGAVVKASGERSRRRLVILAVLSAVVCLITIHYASFRAARTTARQQFETDMKLLDAFDKKSVSLPAPPFDSFGEYVRREYDVGRRLGPIRIEGIQLVAWWVIDGLLLGVGAVTTAMVTGKRSAPASQAAQQEAA